MDNRKNILSALKVKSSRFNIPVALSDAIICQESGYEQWRARFEKKRNVFQIPDKYSKLNRISLDTEIQLQRFSFGLFQILGSTARWLGYNACLTQLCDIETNLYWGLKYLEKLSSRYTLRDDIIAAYNAGSALKKADGSYENQDYVNGVNAFIAANKLS